MAEDTRHGLAPAIVSNIDNFARVCARHLQRSGENKVVSAAADGATRYLDGSRVGLECMHHIGKIQQW